MRRWPLSLFSLCLLIGCKPVGEPQLYFSPEGGAQGAVVERLDGADSRIQVAMYAFTARELAQALVRAKDRGVRVEVLLDGEFANSCEFSKHEFLHRRGVEVRLAPTHEKGEEGRMHHKFCLVDGRVLITGSYNWTASAEYRNEEDLLIFDHAPGLVSRYQSRFEELWVKATPLAELKGMDPPLLLSAHDLNSLRQNAGKEAIVRGKVYRTYHSKRSDTYFLDFGETRDCFTAVIFRSVAKEFRALGVDPLSFKGKVVEVRGVVADHPKYGLQVILESPDQIRIPSEPLP